MNTWCPSSHGILASQSPLIFLPRPRSSVRALMLQLPSPDGGLCLALLLTYQWPISPGLRDKDSAHSFLWLLQQPAQCWAHRGKEPPGRQRGRLEKSPGPHPQGRQQGRRETGAQE